MKDYQGVYQLFKSEMRAAQSGSKMILILDQPYTKKEHKRVIDLMENQADTTVIISLEHELAAENPKLGKIKGLDFILARADRKPLKNGSKLRLKLERLYDKPSRRQIVDLELQNCTLSMRRVQPELDLKEDE